MDIIIAINVVCAAALCLIIGWVIVTPRIHEGPIIKIGLVMLSCSLFGISALLPSLADEPLMRPFVHALLIGNCGIVIAVGGLAWRIWRRPEARAAAVALTGWPELTDHPIDPLGN